MEQARAQIASASPAYLRGIETLKSPINNLFVFRSPAYLRGIETLLLKRAYSAGQWSPAYLRGIETTIS